MTSLSWLSLMLQVCYYHVRTCARQECLSVGITARVYALNIDSTIVSFSGVTPDKVAINNITNNTRRASRTGRLEDFATYFSETEMTHTGTTARHNVVNEAIVTDHAATSSSRRAKVGSVHVDFTMTGIYRYLSKSELNSGLRKQGLREVKSLLLKIFLPVGREGEKR